jgi:light-regulated signal transduction histidine kinase (bacteriophytochrome)
MVARQAVVPAFGQADLSNCEREQIHLPESIQPHGALLVVRLPDLIVTRASLNVMAFLDLPVDPVGATLEALGGDLRRVIDPHLDVARDGVPVAVRVSVGRRAQRFDLLLHRPAADLLIIELEPAGSAVDLSLHVERALQTILGATSPQSLGDEAARLFRDLTGYDRVMVYRFDDEGHGEVLAEQRRDGLESFLGNRYPASDIPQIARRLYERNRVRVLADIEYAPVRLRPGPEGPPLDMSLCVLRSVSPIHVQYLRNMGVRATLVVSLMVGGRLWGLIACHHDQPRFVHFEIRAVCDLLAEAVGTRIAALQSFAEGQAELSVRRLETRMAEAIAREGDWRSGLFDSSNALLSALGASGAALLYEGACQTKGEVPGTQQLRDLGAWLDSRPRGEMVATASLRSEAPQFGYLTPIVSGLVAVPVSQSPGEYLLWFRPERVRTVTWGGDPFKPVLVGDTPADLSPRRSFAKWHQLVEGTSDPWSTADLAAARLIGESVTDVVVQFRAVRLLIAQDQLAQVTREVRLSGQPLIVADAGGSILMSNESFRGLLSTGAPPPTHLSALLDLLSDGGEQRRSLYDLLRQRRPWRGEVAIATDQGEAKPLLLRADPVLSAPDRVLGFVLLFSDLSERKDAEAARKRFQEDISDGNRTIGNRLGPQANPIFQSVLASLVENAQLAAMEITEAVPVARLPQMLESVQASVLRAAKLLGHLIWHASRSLDMDA